MLTPQQTVLHELNAFNYIDISRYAGICSKDKLTAALNVLKKRYYVQQVGKIIFVKTISGNIPDTIFDTGKQNTGWFCKISRSGRYYNEVLLPMVKAGGVINPNNIELID